MYPHGRAARWIGPVVFILLGSGAAIWYGDPGLSAVEQAVARTLTDPMHIFADRSPGARAPGALAQTKPVRNLIDAAAMPPVPQNNLMETSPLPVLGEEAPTVPTAFSAIVPPETVGAPVEGVPGAPVVPIGGGPPVLLLPTSPPVIIGTPPPVLTPGPPVLTPGPPVIGPDLPPNVPPVPEPASWATMIVGFLLVGGALRRARRDPSRAKRSGALTVH